VLQNFLQYDHSSKKWAYDMKSQLNPLNHPTP
jgi:hypothetical protein